MPQMPPRSPAALEPKQDRSRATRRRLLDAAVDELLGRGCASLTIQAVAARAGVSRGAAQNHFPQKTTLVAEAVRHLGQLQTTELQETLARAPGGAKRVRAALDVIFAQYGSGRFAAIVDLSLAARQDPELHDVVYAEERAIASHLNEVAAELFGAERAHTRACAERWATALSAIRGLALLKLLGHPPETVDRQWKATRRDVIALLAQDA
jgi:AcrR family transcriptional regulator